MSGRNDKSRKSSKKSTRRAAESSSGGCSSINEVPPNSCGIRMSAVTYNDLANTRGVGPASGTVRAGDGHRDLVDDVADNESTRAGYAGSRQARPHPFGPPRPDFLLAPGLFVQPGLAQTGYVRDNRNTFQAPRPRRNEPLLRNTIARGLGNQDKDRRQDDYFLGHEYDIRGIGDQFNDNQYLDNGTTSRVDPTSAAFYPSRCEHGFAQWHCPYPNCYYRS